MMKYLRKNNKKILAVFTAMLMIAFIADTGYRRYSAASQLPGRVVGKAGDKELRTTDVETAEAELRLLLYNAVRDTRSPNPDQRFVSILQGLPREVVDEWLERPVTFALLKEEARRMPVYVNEQTLDLTGLLVRLPDRRVLPIEQAPEDFAAQVRYAVGDYFRVLSAFARAGAVVKISQPFTTREAVMRGQEISLRYVPVSAKDFLERAPQPTEEQLANLFKKYADVPSSEVGTDANPLGIGYRYAPRIKFQAISIPRDQLRQAVKAKKDDYQWELDANKYYLQNQNQFARPQLGAGAQPATQPTTRPFAEVREQVLERIMTPQMNMLGDEIRRRIEETMTADYQAWAKAHAGGPTTGPAATQPATQSVASSLGVPYESYDYLAQLAQRIQQQYKVLPSTISVGELKSEKQLEDAPGVGTVVQDLFAHVEPFVAPDRRDKPDVLSIMEPAPPRADAGGTTHVIRITEADTAHAPKDLSEVREQVAQDSKRLWAWDQAKAEAQRLLDAARQSGDLKAAAGQRSVVATGAFRRFGFEDVRGVKFDNFASRMRFTSEAYKLVSQAATPTTQPSATQPAATQPTMAQGPAPMRLIELPGELEVLIAELASVTTDANPDELALARIRQPLEFRQEWQMRMMPRWMSYEAVSSRLAYEDHEAAARQANAAASP